MSQAQHAIGEVESYALTQAVTRSREAAAEYQRLLRTVVQRVCPLAVGDTFGPMFGDDGKVTGVFVHTAPVAEKAETRKEA